MLGKMCASKGVGSAVCETYALSICPSVHLSQKFSFLYGICVLLQLQTLFFGKGMLFYHTLHYCIAEIAPAYHSHVSVKTL